MVCLCYSTPSQKVCLSIAIVAVAVETHPQTSNVSISDDFSLSCTASAFPQSDITWLHNSTEVVAADDDRITISGPKPPPPEVSPALSPLSMQPPPTVGSMSVKLELLQAPTLTRQTVLLPSFWFKVNMSRFREVNKVIIPHCLLG